MKKMLAVLLIALSVICVSCSTKTDDAVQEKTPENDTKIQETSDGDFQTEKKKNDITVIENASYGSNISIYIDGEESSLGEKIIEEEKLGDMISVTLSGKTYNGVYKNTVLHQDGDYYLTADRYSIFSGNGEDTHFTVSMKYNGEGFFIGPDTDYLLNEDFQSRIAILQKGFMKIDGISSASTEEEIINAVKNVFEDEMNLFSFDFCCCEINGKPYEEGSFKDLVICDVCFFNEYMGKRIIDSETKVELLCDGTVVGVNVAPSDKYNISEDFDAEKFKEESIDILSKTDGVKDIKVRSEYLISDNNGLFYVISFSTKDDLGFGRIVETRMKISE